MPRRSSHDDALNAVAQAQSGLITAAQLRSLGVAPGTCARRLATGGMWTRVLPGVHLVTGGQPDPYQRERAALLYAGPASVLTGLTALRRHGFRSLRLREQSDDRRTPEPVFVLLPHRNRRVATSYVRIERTTRPPADDEIVHRNELRLSSPARAVADASRRLRDMDDVAAIVTEGVRLGLLSWDDLGRELDAGPTRGSRHLRAAVRLARSGAWSAPEARLIDISRTAGLPEPQHNVVVLTPAGEYLARPDAWYDDVALAVEVDSQEHHADGADWRRTLARQRRYAEFGVVVVPVTPRELATSAREVTRAIAAAYRAAAARPRPPVRVATGPAAAARVREPGRWAG